jgi:hypothetical protein
MIFIIALKFINPIQTIEAAISRIPVKRIPIRSKINMNIVSIPIPTKNARPILASAGK